MKTIHEKKNYWKTLYSQDVRDSRGFNERTPI